MDYFPNNTLASFTTRLPQVLDLDGFWEIGLAEIQYPHSWYNVRKNEAWILFTDIHHEKHVLVLPEGYYASPKRIVKAFEAMKQQKEMKKEFSLNMSEVDDKATLWVRDISQVIISPLLNSLLGFDKLDFSPANHTAPYVSDVHQGHHSLYLYCPLKEWRMVGDAKVPLLRIVPVAGRHGKMMTRAFDHIQYCPLAQRRFQDIQIDIRDDTGKVVPFERGTVVVTLHCRKKKTYLE
jgi:hypothetical protein